ncbi:NADH dehydrogenase subunit 4L (mitochondrion) [Galendromus occidentalis]|uniref:NADH dehydrogenase subunit 4L n=1 Tax=Galendromus occidentalis TaxID=34638 RepID=A3RE64_9ACAR|nr:NADH dehydrogenase subunit 4L [Galendromus occidentalis]YP_001096014.1 NADH dehydrogenase subunit 4L [Galendromus occidentalis]ABN45838.1 NADH dehydrogenase subunit 4L [Galendromus occidentalis]ABN45849.1 NADH dehydrogenase subunit 4L [Galendromus occidentalis]
MMLLFVFFIFSGLVNIFFFCYSLLSVMISMEFMVIFLFFIVLKNFYSEEYFALLLFLVMVVSDSILGLVLLTLKVFFSGDDMINLIDVF